MFLRNLKIIKSSPGKSSAAWTKKKSIPRVLYNWFLARLADMFPFAQQKQFFYRAMGIKIGKNVQILPQVFLDIFFPELITIEDNVVIGMDAFLSCHEFNPTEFRYGPITIKKNALIGARAFVLPGVVIGENSLVGAMTVVHSDVPANTLAFGSPMQFKKLSK
ncbi:2,3,4,5-tetrahydropyridine-2,6-dicarboxylate N-acetyltransferase [uncultured archaeon]|nr:2,3,4,5-tetrahydropyridine-2,6-dicarboxylate N-acetyltransferase [uncultured archaeon]